MNTHRDWIRANKLPEKLRVDTVKNQNPKHCTLQGYLAHEKKRPLSRGANRKHSGLRVYAAVFRGVGIETV
jgi:hypothetical protein